MGVFQVEVWLYCFVNYADKSRFPWRRMTILESKNHSNYRHAHECGDLLCDVHKYQEVEGKRAVMYDIV
jgi:hypothetical protein